MIRFQDRVTLGAISGLLTIIPIRLLNALEYNLGLTDEKYNQSGSSLMLPKGYTRLNTTKEKIVGAMVNNTMVAMSGSILAYLLSITGRDKAMLKGAGFSAVEWVAFWGAAARLGLKRESKNPTTYILTFVDHILFGMSTALLIIKFGDDSLFPDMKARPGEKLPIIPKPPQESMIKDLRRHRH